MRCLCISGTVLLFTFLISYCSTHSFAQALTQAQHRDFVGGHLEPVLHGKNAGWYRCALDNESGKPINEASVETIQH